MTHTMYMIVTRDKFQFPLYWGETLGELSRRSGRDYQTLQKGFDRLRRKSYRRTEYEIVRFSDRD